MMPYFEIAEFRALMPQMDNEAKHPDARVGAARDWIEGVIERTCQTSFIPRTITETLLSRGGTALFLGTIYVQSVSSVKINGVADSDYTHSANLGVLRRRVAGSPIPRAWPDGDVEVEYVAGYTATCPSDLKIAAMEAARDRVIKWSDYDGRPSERATSVTNEIGGTTAFSTADPEHPTGLPDVDAVIVGWRDRVTGPGVA